MYKGRFTFGGGEEQMTPKEKRKRVRRNKMFAYRGHTFLIVGQEVSDQLHLFNPRTKEAKYLMDINKKPADARKAAQAIVKIMMSEQALHEVEYRNPPVAPVNPKRAMAESIGADVVEFDA